MRSERRTLLPYKICKLQSPKPGNSTNFTFTACPNYLMVKEILGKKRIINNIYHTSSNNNEVTLSIEDRRFVDIIEKGIHKNEFGNWQLPLPFRSPNIILPNNREQAVRRLSNLLRVFARKPNMKKDYFEFMGKLLKHNHATPLPESRAIRGQDHDDIKRRNVWYLPHFGVYHPRKPNSIRVVFDSSSEYQGTSLNKELLSGPDFLNSLHGILIRFRQEAVGVICDIEQMFHCFYVNPEHRDVLRFLWFKNNDPTD